MYGNTWDVYSIDEARIYDDIIIHSDRREWFHTLDALTPSR